MLTKNRFITLMCRIRGDELMPKNITIQKILSVLLQNLKFIIITNMFYKGNCTVFSAEQIHYSFLEMGVSN